MDANRLWPLDGRLQSYDWGSRTAIAELRGELPTGSPQAELWFGAHPSAPSALSSDSGDEIPLDRWIRSDPEAILGARVVARFGAELPFLLKVIAAARPLSIQVHPNAAQARTGFASENTAGVPVDAPHRRYRDPRHKPELICALTPFRALVGFREPAEIERRFAALGVRELETHLVWLHDASPRDQLASLFGSWMTIDRDVRIRLVDRAAQAALHHSDTDPDFAELVRLATDHPGDAGALAPLFLNRVELAPGEAMYLAPGQLHGYLGGTAVELMANSDNVLRGGLTSKFVDVPELLATIDFRAGAVDRPRPVQVGPVEQRYEIPADEFSLSVLRLGPRDRWQAPAQRGAEVLLCTAGSVRIADGCGREFGLARGKSCFAPAAAGAYTVAGDGTVYRAMVGETS